MFDFIVDDFAAAGGWDQGVRDAGYTGKLVGVEWDASAVATAKAAGHERIHGDVRLETSKLIDRLIWEHGRGAAVRWLYIASPPCQTFSAAGKGTGRKHMEALLQAVEYVGTGMTPENAIAEVSDEALDERSVLVLHPLQMIRRHRPTAVLLEQVKEVKPVWLAYVKHLESWGYKVRVEIAKAERYGVPQTRRRAILSATLHGEEAAWPVATHSEFYPRNRTKLDEGVERWVTMAEALGWGMTDRPYFTVAGGTAAGGADTAMVGGSGSRSSLYREVDEGRWVHQRSNYSAGGKPGQTAEERGRSTRELDEPSVAITSKGFHWAFGDVVQKNGSVRTQDEPAPTITSSADNGNFRFFVAAGATGEGRPRDVDTDPAATLTGKGTAYFLGGEEVWRQSPGEEKRDMVRVTVPQVGILQSFPADYPWQGTKTKQYEQVGNAVPPRMAAAFVQAHLG